MKYIFVVVFVILLNSCEDRFRYECQNPDNWSKSECQKPNCIPYGICTDSLIAKEKIEECK